MNVGAYGTLMTSQEQHGGMLCFLSGLGLGLVSYLLSSSDVVDDEEISTDTVLVCIIRFITKQQQVKTSRHPETFSAK